MVSKGMLDKFNNELLSSLRLLNSSQDAISSKLEGALKRISNNEANGIILHDNSMRCGFIAEPPWS